MSRILLSYRREDSSADAGRIADRLRQHFGEENVFVDIDTILPGDDFTQRIESSLKACDALVAVIGRNWSAAADSSGRRRLERPDDYVRLEIATALRRNIRVVPALVRDAVMPGASELPEELSALSRRQALEISDARFHHDVDRLIEALEAGDRSRSPVGIRIPSGWRSLRIPGGWLAPAIVVAALIGVLLWAMGGWTGAGYGAPDELQESEIGSSAQPTGIDAGTIYKVGLDRYGEAYFTLSSPLTEARLTLDVRCADSRPCSVATFLSLLDARGTVVGDRTIRHSVFDVGFRSVRRLTSKQGEKWQVKLVNESDKRVDHWLTVSSGAEAAPVPLFGEVPAQALPLDTNATGLLDAGGAAYFTMALAKGDYVATLDYSASPRAPTVLAGHVSIVNEGGGDELSPLYLNEYSVSARVSSPFSLDADGSYGVRVQNRADTAVNYVLRLAPR